MLRKVAEGDVNEEPLAEELEKIHENFMLLVPQADRSPHIGSVLRTERELLSEAQLE